MKFSILCAGFLGGILLVPEAVAERKFTSADGKELVAEIIAATEAEVTLKKSSDGKEYTLPLARFSKEDQDFVAAWLAKAKLNKRAERELELSTRDGEGEAKKVTVPKGEFMSADGVLTLYPGDTVHVEFQKEGEKLGGPTIVAEVTHPERTITFAMSHQKGIAFLMRTTEMQETVAFDCTHCAIGSDDFARTNLIPTEKGLAAGDSWPGNVWIVRVMNLEVSKRPAMEVYQEKVGK